MVVTAQLFAEPADRFIDWEPLSQRPIPALSQVAGAGLLSQPLENLEVAIVCGARARLFIPGARGQQSAKPL